LTLGLSWQRNRDDANGIVLRERLSLSVFICCTCVFLWGKKKGGDKPNHRFSSSVVLGPTRFDFTVARGEKKRLPPARWFVVKTSLFLPKKEKDF